MATTSPIQDSQSLPIRGPASLSLSVSLAHPWGDTIADTVTERGPRLGGHELWASYPLSGQ